MPCYKASTHAGATSSSPAYKSEAECLQACKEGACCEGTTCTIKPQCQCQGTGKTFKGVGTICEPNPCLPCACPANSHPAFPSSMTFSCVIESATAQQSQSCASAYSSDFIALVNGFSVTAPVSCTTGPCAASASSEQSAQLSGTPSTPPCDRYMILEQDTKNDIYIFGASLSCNGQLAVGLGSSSFSLYRNATAIQYASHCQSLGELAYQLFWLYIPLNVGANGSGNKLLSVTPPCEGPAAVARTNVLSGVGYLGARYTPDCNQYSQTVFQGAYPMSGGAYFDISARIECRMNYGNPLP